jgi:hypothetical protein
MSREGFVGGSLSVENPSDVSLPVDDVSSDSATVQKED